jgi:hypothetical protein
MIQTLLLAALAVVAASPAFGQAAKWSILDNSFLIEESFNQERGVMQNILTWTATRSGEWQATFTQEWPAPSLKHQFSYTIPFSRADGSTGLNDAMINYRYQLTSEGTRTPALSPRASLILPTGHADTGFGSGTAGLQFVLPASKQIGDFYVHANAGLTWLPGVSTLPYAGASGIWQTTAMFHLMIEAIVAGGNSMTVAPGFRRGWNFGDRQVVIGAAVPVTRSDGRSTTALLSYFSYELPFR